MSVFLENRVLLEQFRMGERAALEYVYRYYFDDVCRLVQFGFVTRNGTRAPRMTNEADRLDFVQDVFVKAFSESARLAYDGLRPYRPMLLQIARNLRIDRLRQSGREVSLQDAARASGSELNIDDLIERNAVLPHFQIAESDLHWQRLKHETGSVLVAVGAELQAIAQLRFADELSQADVAERLGVTRRRVRTLEGQLLRLVRRHLSRSGLAPAEK